jgi:uncharacterized delta-60 repeat protein
MRSLRLLRAVQNNLAKQGSALNRGVCFIVLLLGSLVAQGQIAPGAFKFTTGTFTAGEGDGQLLIAVTRTNGVGKMAVDVQISDGTATNKTDYSAPTNVTLTFSNYQTSVTFPITITDNSAIRTGAQASANLVLTNARPAADEDQTLVGSVDTALGKAKFNIVDNDGTNQFNIEKTVYQVSETGGTITVNVKLSAPPTDKSSGVSVDYAVMTDTSFALQPGSDYATADQDYVAQSGTLNFGPNDTQQSITIEILQDQLVEFNEDLFVVLSNPQGKLTIDVPSSGGTTGTTGAAAGSATGATDGSDDTGDTSGTTAGTTGITTSGITTGTATGGTTGSTTGATDSGTDSGGGTMTMDVPYTLGPISKATVTILFNGDPAYPQPAGAIDQTYNPDNDPNTFPPLLSNPGALQTVFAVALQPDGKTVIGGEFTSVNATPINHIARLNTNGTLDATFTPVGGANDFVTAVAVYTNGVNKSKILLGGGFTSVNGIQRNSIARMNTDGSLDESFDPGTGANGPIYSIAIQRDGAVLIGGDFTTYDGVARNRIARLLASGALDIDFDPGSGADGPVYAIYTEAIKPLDLIKTNSPANNTNTNAVSMTFPLGATSASILLRYNFFADTNSIRVLYGGQTVFFSLRTNTPFVLVTNVVDNSVTTNFLEEVKAIEVGPGASSSITVIVNGETSETPPTWEYSLRIYPNLLPPRIPIGGDFTSVGGVVSTRIAQLSPAGVVDTNFATQIGIGADAPVQGITIQTNGEIVLVGGFKHFNSAPAFGVMRLTRAGTPDKTFFISPGANDSVLAVAVQPDNKLLIGGYFTSYNQTRRLEVARLLQDGSLDTSFMDSAYNEYAGLPNSAGLVPNGFVASLIYDAATTNIIIGGGFDTVGGGATRESTHPRINVARLVGGETPGPGNVQFLANIFGGNENGGALVAGVVRTNGMLGPFSVLGYTTDGSATASLDYKGVTNAVSWKATTAPSIGSNSNQNFVVQLIDDTLIEGDETFDLHLATPIGQIVLGGEIVLSGAALGPPDKARGNIIDNDMQTSVMGFSSPEYDANEDSPSVTITVTRTGNVGAAASVHYTTVQSTNQFAATEGVDYEAASGVLNFAGGQTNRTFTITLKDDNVVEQDEEVLLRLNGPSQGAVISTNAATATLTIVDNDFAPGRISLSATNYNVIEGSNAVVTIKRTGGNVGVIKVNYSTVDDTAQIPFDYTETFGTLTWNDGESAPKTVTIPVLEDGLVEGNETFHFLLSDPSIPDALGARTNATVTIIDNDAFGTFLFNAPEYLADENGTNVTITVIRRNGSAQTATVDYATTDGTGVAARDYQSVKGTLTFDVGETSKSFIVPIIDNTATNAERTVKLTLSNPQPAGASLGNVTNATLAIIDNESFNIPAGSVNTGFGTGSGANDIVEALAIQADGKIVIAGDFSFVNLQSRPHIARLNPDSTLDLKFEPDYVINGPIRAVDLTTDGHILIAGSFTQVEGLPYNYLARVSTNGARDNRFDVGSGADNPIFAVKETFVDANRKVLVGGAFSIFNGVPRRGIARVNEDGHTDTSFDPGAGVNGTVYSLAIQRDGKILVGGEFGSVNGILRNNIARLNPDGSLDESFDAGLGADGSVRAIAVGFDDRIYIGGLFTSVTGVLEQHLARLNADGRLDSSFVIGTGANGPIFALGLQMDGKLVVGGDFTDFNGFPENRIVRLNDDGSVDTSINFGAGANAFISAIGIQADRQIVIGGGFTSVDNFPRNHFARLYGGSIAGAGEIEYDLPNFIVSETATNAVIQVRRAGGLVGTVSALAYTSAGTATPNVDYINVTNTITFGPGENLKSFLVPLIDDNLPEPDETVNLTLTNVTGGAAIKRQPVAVMTIISDDTLLNFSQAAFSVSETAPGGKATIGISREGATEFPVSVIFSTSPGTASSGSDYQDVSQVINFGVGDSIKYVSVPITDDIIVEDNETINLHLTSPSVGGLLGHATAVLTIIDNDFAPGILELATGQSVSENAGSIGITVNRRSGKTGNVTVDYAISSGTATSGVDFVGSTGTLTFQEGETVKTFFVPIIDDSAIEGNEDFTVTLSNPTGGAQLSNASTTVQIIDDDLGPGSLDQQFDTSGGTDGPVNSIYLQPDGKIIVGGAFSVFGFNSVGNLTRVNPDGSIDAGFSAGVGTDGAIDSVALRADGKIVFGGAFTTFGGISRKYVGRVSTNGLADANFNRSAAENAEVFAVAPQPDGKTVIGGDFTTPARRILRLNGDGSLDVSFNPEAGTDARVNVIKIQSDGKILVGGAFISVNGTTIRGIARLLANGLLDTSFKIGTGANGTVHSILIQPDGKIVIAGEFTGVNGASHSKVARLNADGSVDGSFAGSGSINGSVMAAAYSAGKIYIGGDFTAIGSATRNRVARLNSEGTLDQGFDPGLGPDATVLTMSAQPDGQIIIGGSFITVNGFNSEGLARLNGDKQQPPAEVRISNMFVSNGTINFTFASQPGRTYFIESSQDLQTWQPAQTVTAVGSATQFSEPVAAGSNRFYRVRLQ